MSSERAAVVGYWTKWRKMKVKKNKNKIKKKKKKLYSGGDIYTYS